MENRKIQFFAKNLILTVSVKTKKITFIITGTIITTHFLQKSYIIVVMQGFFLPTYTYVTRITFFDKSFKTFPIINEIYLKKK